MDWWLAYTCVYMYWYRSYIYPWRHALMFIIMYLFLLFMEHRYCNISIPLSLFFQQKKKKKGYWFLVGHFLLYFLNLKNFQEYVELYSETDFFVVVVLMFQASIITRTISGMNMIFMQLCLPFQLEIPNQLLDPIVFNSWMTLFLNMLERSVPLEGQPADPEMRKTWGWWKVMKWTVHILNRLYTRWVLRFYRSEHENEPCIMKLLGESSLLSIQVWRLENSKPRK